MSKGGRYLSKPKPSQKIKKRLTIFFTAVLLVIALVVGSGILYYDYILGLIGQAEYIDKNPSNEDILSILRPEGEEGEDYSDLPMMTLGDDTEQQLLNPGGSTYEPDYDKVGKVINIMIVGQQFRQDDQSRLADTMILATLNVETKTLTLTSFLRDMYIKLPNYAGKTCGSNRINTCYALGYAWGHTKGAMEMLSLLMQEQFGVEVDYTIEIGMHSFKSIIDILGGIEVELTAEEAKYMNEAELSRSDFVEGKTTLDGNCALGYVRMRKSSAADNDFKRTSRQREVITKVLEKCSTMSLLQLNEMLNEVLPLLVTDMPSEVITTYAMELLPILPGLTIESNQCPADGTYGGKTIEIYGVESSVLVPNVQKNREILMAIAEWDQLNAGEN